MSTDTIDKFLELRTTTIIAILYQYRDKIDPLVFEEIIARIKNLLPKP